MIRSINSTKLKSKFLGILFIVFALSGLVMILFAKTVERSYNQLLYEKTDQLLAYFSGNLETQLKSIENLSGQIIADKTVQADLSGIFNNRHRDYNNAVLLQRVTQTLSSYMMFQSNITSISIYTSDFRAVSGWDTPIAGGQQLEALKTRMKEARGSAVWQVYSDRGSLLCAREIREIEHIDMNTLGYLIIHIDLPRIIRNDKLAFNEIGYELDMEIRQDGDTYVYPTAPTKFSQVQFDSAQYGVVDVEGHKYFAVNRSSDYTDWTYRIFLDFHLVYGSTRRAILGAMLLSVLGMALLASLGGYFVASQTTHFELLIEKINRFYQSNMQPSIQNPAYEDRFDEIGILHRSFDKMTREISAHVQENYLKTILLKEAQIQLLQEQVNPHFLFNTLNLTSWMAKNGDSAAVTAVIEALSRLLRSGLEDRSATISVLAEISLVNDYLYILKFRYGDRLVYSQSIEPAAQQVQIPKMAIQGLVENSINHAMENMTDACHIHIEGRIQDSRAVVSVRDNGPGMDVDILQKLRDKTLQPRGIGVGLENIDNRIKLIYSEEYGLRIHSEPDGARVSMELPADERMAEAGEGEGIC